MYFKVIAFHSMQLPDSRKGASHELMGAVKFVLSFARTLSPDSTSATPPQALGDAMDVPFISCNTCMRARVCACAFRFQVKIWILICVCLVLLWRCFVHDKETGSFLQQLSTGRYRTRVLALRVRQNPTRMHTQSLTETVPTMLRLRVQFGTDEIAPPGADMHTPR